MRRNYRPFWSFCLGGQLWQEANLLSEHCIIACWVISGYISSESSDWLHQGWCREAWFTLWSWFQIIITYTHAITHYENPVGYTQPHYWVTPHVYFFLITRNRMGIRRMLATLQMVWTSKIAFPPPVRAILFTTVNRVLYKEIRSLSNPFPPTVNAITSWCTPLRAPATCAVGFKVARSTSAA